ncbi:YHS domain-containing protein, partial [Candidatus Micrarchaeota archaeon]|nr:YHS domain-containing protein [Candidatus Micrarchaeota archaeon]
MAKDPVCGMNVPDDAPLRAKQDGVEYLFCSQTCLKEFTQPARQARRVLILAVFSLSLGAFTAFFEYVSPASGLPITNEMLLFLLATPVQFGAGWLFYRGSIDALKARRANMDLLIAIGTSAAWLYSTLFTFQGILWGFFLPSLGMGTQVFFTESGLIIGFILAGKYGEHLVKGRATRAITKLMDLRPKQALVVKGGREQPVPVDELRVGDIVVVKPGERVPADGIV